MIKKILSWFKKPQGSELVSGMLTKLTLTDEQEFSCDQVHELIDQFAELQMKGESVEQLMPLIPLEERRDIQRLGSYPEDTAGAVMTSEFARLSESLTVGEALLAFREIFVEDEGRNGDRQPDGGRD